MVATVQKHMMLAAPTPTTEPSPAPPAAAATEHTTPDDTARAQEAAARTADDEMAKNAAEKAGIKFWSATAGAGGTRVGGFRLALHEKRTLGDYSMVFLGPDQPALTNIMLSLPGQKVHGRCWC